MRPKYFFMTLTAALMLLLGAFATCAQVGELHGHVLIKQADGTTAPLPNAVIDVYRTDISGKFNTKTDKKGKFAFAGLPLGFYNVAASAPTASPNFLPHVRVGQDVDYELVLTPGDGKRLTEAEIKGATPTTAAASSSAAPAKESAADKAKREAMEAENRKIEESNKKAVSSNELVNQTLKAGNEALGAKNYDEAVAQYSHGITDAPDHPGAPVLLTNRSVAYRARGVDRFNAAIRSTDDAAKAAGIEAAKKDWQAAAEDSTKAVQMLKAATPPTDPKMLENYNRSKYLALLARMDAMKLFVPKVAAAQPDAAAQADAGLAAFQEYIAEEPDAAKKATAQRDAAQMLLDAGAADKAFGEFQKILAANPNDPDANLGAGLALFSTQDKAKYQDAANYLQKFVDTAPETHKMKADAKAILTELKNTEKVVPTNTGRGRRKG
ncbi:MAG TPA: carboxypeptidase regulatory-like domain-containing protein [Pyrinomonadaceae bacterium]|nr:carboxypeptidase regulatory-like domain-containing protein [Pyrinomonadaceae bacterium]